MEKVFKFVKGGWLVVVIISLVFAVYTALFDGINQDFYLSLVFAVFGAVMYYLNVRRVKMYQEKTSKKRK